MAEEDFLLSTFQELPTFETFSWKKYFKAFPRVSWLPDCQLICSRSLYHFYFAYGSKKHQQQNLLAKEQIFIKSPFASTNPPKTNHPLLQQTHLPSSPRALRMFLHRQLGTRQHHRQHWLEDAAAVLVGTQQQRHLAGGAGPFRSAVFNRRKNKKKKKQGFEEVLLVFP